jgi:hypothetical protein
MTTPPTRRSFLAALAATIAAPRILAASTAPASTTASLAEILNRPIALAGHQQDYATCYCERCESARAVAMRCRSCGFAGQPMVFPCDCDWRFHVEELEDERRDPAGYSVRQRHPDMWPARSPEEIDHELAWYRAQGPCSPAHGCCHGDVACPVCGDTGDGCYVFGTSSDEEGAEARAAATMIRDLRAALRARGLA